MKFYFLFHWLFLVAIIFLALLITPIRLKVIAFRWLVGTFVRNHHISRNGSGRKRKSVQKAAREFYEKEAKRERIGDETSADYRNQKWPGHRTGD